MKQGDNADIHAENGAFTAAVFFMPKGGSAVTGHGVNSNALQGCPCSGRIMEEEYHVQKN